MDVQSRWLQNMIKKKWFEKSQTEYLISKVHE